MVTDINTVPQWMFMGSMLTLCRVPGNFDFYTLSDLDFEVSAGHLTINPNPGGHRQLPWKWILRHLTSDIGSIKQTVWVSVCVCVNSQSSSFLAVPTQRWAEKNGDLFTVSDFISCVCLSPFFALICVMGFPFVFNTLFTSSCWQEYNLSKEKHFWLTWQSVEFHRSISSPSRFLCQSDQSKCPHWWVQWGMSVYQ